MRVLLVLIAVALTGGTATATLTAPPPRLAGHALLVNEPGLRVYGPALHATTPCPRLLPLPAHALRTVKRAVELAMPPFEKPVHLDGHDAQVTVAPTNRSAFDYRAGGCGPAAWARSVYAEVYLPHVTDSASLSQHRFAVGRVREGWVIWGYIH